MTNAEQLRDEYLARVCGALSEYLGRGLPIHLHSDSDGERLDITFTIEHPDTFHALLEGRTPPEPAKDPACASTTR